MFVKQLTGVFTLFVLLGGKLNKIKQNKIRYEHSEVQKIKVWNLHYLSDFIGLLVDGLMIKPKANHFVACFKHENFWYSEGSFYPLKERKCISMHKVSGK